MSAIGIDPVAQRPSSGLTTARADGDAGCAVDEDADAVTTTVGVAVGLGDAVAPTEQPKSARDKPRSQEPLRIGVVGSFR